ncbi:lactate/malate dehydrogenase family protein [Planctomycetaceae bacterium]|jgi:L-lactate dehydrogenase|nr:lactate/malate dehydrogenase family protein [bacterium]MDB4786895.1 lactate/malate dehydrogenase family protein [Planctomycetaceae bacterium]MDC0261648.1 lactate/malate dehydrogenase family protein [Planctomycetaceae bacterium]MDC0273958.1 lactate/malate dehydrogenase family protein [Planctomycetaceae bacterium]MDC0308436.1 lactate/malate dehydrogenase family protein [Planctomycetaceae bacterium]
MKVSIIGGGGLVGSCAGFALQAGGIVRDIALVDINQDLVEGQALDLLHGSSLLHDQNIYAGGTELVTDSDVVVITAGLRRKPDESRLDLINRNVTLFKGILTDIKSHGLKKDAIVFVVSNPVDVLTYLAINELGLPASQVIGLGTVLDTTRLRSMLAARLQVQPTQVEVTIYGEHGDSMVPIWSAAQIAGIPLEKFPGVTQNLIAETEKKTRGSGAEVIKKKGGAGFAVGVSIADVVHSIALDSNRIMPVSSLQNGLYGLRDVSISVPTVVGRTGVLGCVEVDLWPKEKMALQRSGSVLRETLDKVLKG